MRSDYFTPTRRVRRYIQLALTGAALGTMGIAIPSHADVHVNNTDASGPGSLAQAITEGGHIVFDSPLTNGAQFTSALPSITNSLAIDKDSGLNTFILTQGLTVDNDSLLALSGNGVLDDYGITSDLVARGNSLINISNGYTVNGNLSADGAKATVINSALNGQTLKATHGGTIELGVVDLVTSASAATSTGDVLADGVGSNGDSSTIAVYAGSTLTATNLTATDGGYVDVYGATATLTGDVLVDGVGSNVDSSLVQLEDHSSLTATNLNVTDGGRVSIYDGSTVTLTGDALVDGVGSNGISSEIHIESSTLNGNVTATNGGYLSLSVGTITGNVTATNGGYLSLNSGTITGNVTVNTNSILRSMSIITSNNLNADGGTTSFNAGSIYAPTIVFFQTNISSDPISVDDLVVNDTAKIQPNLSILFFPSTPVGSQYGISVLDYNSITGAFDSNVISPLDMKVEYTDSSGANPTPNPIQGDSGQVHLYLNSNTVNFNKLPGSTNAESFGSFLNRVINDSNTDPTTFTLSNLPTQLRGLALGYITDTSFDGNLSSLDDDLPTNYSSYNTQTYWNQRSFVDSILANLNNDRTMKGAASSFTLNQVSNASGAGVQLAALRQATSPGFNRLNYAGDNGGNSNGVWATYNGNHQHTDGDSGVGSTDWSSSANGFTLGYTGGSDNFSWGAAVGYQKSTLNFNDLGANGEQRGWNSGLYASWKSKSTYLTGVLSYGNFDNDSSDSFGDTSFKTKATSAALELGKHLGNNKSDGLTPYAAVQWTRIKQEDVSLSDNPLGLTLKSGSNNVFATKLGVRFNHRMYDKDDTLKGGWQAGVAWLHQGGDTGLPVNVSSTLAPGAGMFGVKSTPLAGNSLLVQLGAYGRIHGNLIGFAGYQGTFGSSQKINAVNAGIGYQF